MEENKPENLETILEQLEKVIEGLEKEEISLETSFALYNQGMEMIKKCNTTIETIERKVQILDQNGRTEELRG